MKFVLIGGGNIGRNNTLYETGVIDQEIVKLCDKENPNLLFIGLASNFSDSYYKAIKDIYGKLGCSTGKVTSKTLKNIEVVREKIANSDIIYIGGGNTVKLVNILRQYKIDEMLKQALNKGCIMAGISAGAIAYCKYGLSDVEIIDNKSDKYVMVDGLGFLDFMFVPHFDKDEKKESDLKEVIKDTNINALCFDDSTAIVIENDKCKFIRDNINKKVKNIYYAENYVKKVLDFDKYYKL